MKIDMQASERQFLDHLAAVWSALPADARGDVIVPRQLREHRASLGIPPAGEVDRSRPILVASYGDVKRARLDGRRRIAYIEHGAGQSYPADQRGAGHPSYAGGRDRGDVGLVMVPGPYSGDLWRKAYPRVRVEEVGCPKLDTLPARDDSPGPVVALAPHWDCFPGDVVVSGPPVVGTATRWYEGDLVVIRTASGNELACTPNHPVLTPEGWVAARTLDPGRCLVRRTGSERMVSPARPDHEQVPSRIEDVARALKEATPMVSMPMPVASEDFHGDGVGGDVAVVTANRALLDDVADAAFGEPFDKLSLLRAGLRTPGLAGDGALLDAGLGPVPAADRSVGGRSHGFAAGGGEARVPTPEAFANSDGLAGLLEPVDHRCLSDSGIGSQSGRRAPGSVLGDEWLNVRPATGSAEAHRFGLAPEDSLAAEVLRDLATGPASGYSETLRRLAGEVLLDEIVEVSGRSFQGHVYNLQTTEGWYEAAGFIVHNCRLVQETRTAFYTYRPALEEIAKRWTVIGHGHPRAMDGPPDLRKEYRRRGIELVEDFADVCRRADLLVFDNTSAGFEFASLGRPVVVLNEPIGRTPGRGYRRDREHGLRFWSAASVGINVWSAADLPGAIDLALSDPPEVAAAREAALGLVYTHRSGAAARAAEAVMDWAANVLEAVA